MPMKAMNMNTAFSSNDEYLRQPEGWLLELLLIEVSDFDIDQGTLCFCERRVLA